MFGSAEKVWDRGGRVRPNVVAGEGNSQPGIIVV